MKTSGVMTTEEAVSEIRSDPQLADLVEQCYWDKDVFSAAKRFHRSAEWRAVLRLLEYRLNGGTVLDLGAGTGIASYAFAESGVRCVYALEPDPSSEIGNGAIAKLRHPVIKILSAFGECIPLPSRSVDVAYCRQVLHHAASLPAMVEEVRRVLKPNGLFVATREHVVWSKRERRRFLADHPIHQKAGGENAFTLREYRSAFENAGFSFRVLRPCDSIINAFGYFPVSDEDTLRSFPERLRERFGFSFPVFEVAFRWRMNRLSPGMMYTFIGSC